MSASSKVLSRWKSQHCFVAAGREPSGIAALDGSRRTANTKAYFGKIALLFGAVLLASASVVPHGNVHAAERHAVVVCGLPGPEPHRENWTAATVAIRAGLEETFGFEPEQIELLVGDETMQATMEEHEWEANIATRESLLETWKQLAIAETQRDQVWVFLLGFANATDGSYRYHVSGTDPNDKALVNGIRSISAKSRIVWVATPCSGGLIAQLSAKGTHVMTATDSLEQVNGVEFGYALADILDPQLDIEPPDDLNDDGKCSLFELYVAVCALTRSGYEGEELILTEHALIDDNGDRRGSESHLLFLEDTLGGMDEEIRPMLARKGADGDASTKIQLPLPVKQPTKVDAEDALEEEAKSADDSSPDDPDGPVSPAPDDSTSEETE